MDYDEVQNLLIPFDIPVEASKFHGQLTALICVGCDEQDIDDWLPMMLPERYLPDSEYVPLTARVVDMYRDIRSNIEEDGFNFDVLLPSEDEPLQIRIEQANGWCSGFLEGLGFAEFSISGDMPEECVEIIEDIRSIAVVELDSDEPYDDQEFDFMTLEEHLRTAVQLFFETVAFYRSRNAAIGVDTVLSA